jgi:hypothetical protein
VKDHDTQGRGPVSTGEERNSGSPAAGEIRQEPKRTFVEPKLTEHGKLTEVTGQFFAGFTPSF